MTDPAVIYALLFGLDLFAGGLLWGWSQSRRADRGQNKEALNA